MCQERASNFEWGVGETKGAVARQEVGDADQNAGVKGCHGIGPTALRAPFVSLDNPIFEVSCPEFYCVFLPVRTTRENDLADSRVSLHR